MYTETKTCYENVNELGKALEAGTLQVGDILMTRVYEEPTAHVVIGIDVDKAIEDYKHTVTIQTLDLPEELPFDENGKNRWGTSSIYSYLNSYEFWWRHNELAGNPHLGTAIVEENGEVTRDQFFLLSLKDYDPTETKYPYYKDFIRNREKFDEIGFKDWRWTRSANRCRVSGVWVVGSLGHVIDYGYAYASGARRFSPACVLIF